MSTRPWSTGFMPPVLEPELDPPLEDVGPVPVDELPVLDAAPPEPVDAPVLEAAAVLAPLEDDVAPEPLPVPVGED